MNNMEEWKKIKISDIGRIVTGKTPRTSIKENYGGYIPFLTPSDDLSNKFAPITNKVLTDKGLMEVRNCLLPENSICVSCIGSDLGKVVMLKKPTVTNQQFNSIIPNENYSPDFVYYLMIIVGKRLNFLSKTSTAVPIINKSTFSNFEVEVPSSLRNQTQIAKILSSLDDKIELNNRINANLEEQAQTLFHRWFVDFEFPNEQGLPYKSNDGAFVESELGRIPKGWISGKFTDIANIQGGGTPQTKNKKFWNGNIPFFTPKDVPNVCFTLFTEKQITEEGLKNCNSKFYPKYTIFITARGTVGKVVIAGQNMAMNQSCYALVGKDDNIQYFVYYYTKELIYLLRNKASGAVFDAITTRDFDSDNVVIPPKGIIIKFQNNIKPLMALILNNCKENQGLIQLRDTILPRLMNNQIKI